MPVLAGPTAPPRNRTDREPAHGFKRIIAHPPPAWRSRRRRRHACRHGRHPGRGEHRRRADRRHHQGGHAAFAVRHHGDQRDHAEGRHADADRAAERQRRAARQEAGSRGGRSRLQLAAVRREGAQLLSVDKCAAVFGCWTSVSRKSVLPVFEELNGILFYPVQYRGPGVQPQRVLHRRRAEPAGDPGGRLPDERREGAALGAGRHRLRLSAHHQPDPGSLPEGREGRRSPTTS